MPKSAEELISNSNPVCVKICFCMCVVQDSADINYGHRPPPVTQSERSRRGPALIESERRDRRSSPTKQSHPSLYEGMPIQDNSRIREKR